MKCSPTGKALAFLTFYILKGKGHGGIMAHCIFPFFFNPSQSPAIVALVCTCLQRYSLRLRLVPFHREPEVYKVSLDEDRWPGFVFAYFGRSLLISHPPKRNVKPLPASSTTHVCAPISQIRHTHVCAPGQPPLRQEKCVSFAWSTKMLLQIIAFSHAAARHKGPEP